MSTFSRVAVSTLLAVIAFGGASVPAGAATDRFDGYVTIGGKPATRGSVDAKVSYVFVDRRRARTRYTVCWLTKKQEPVFSRRCRRAQTGRRGARHTTHSVARLLGTTTVRWYVGDRMVARSRYTLEGKAPAPVPEQEGIRRIKSRAEVRDLLHRYGRRVTFEGADLEEPGEARFLPQVDPGFRDQPGCIILVRSPGGGWAYQLEEDDRTVVHRVTIETWDAGLRRVSAEDRRRFDEQLGEE